MSEFGAEEGFIAGPCKEMGNSCSENPKLPKGFQAKHFWKPGQGVEGCKVLLCSRSQSPELREQDIHSNANAKREFIASSSQGPSYIQRNGVERGPQALNYSSIYRLKTKTGSWQGWIDCKGSLASTNWLDFHVRAFSGGLHPRPDKLEPGYREYTDWSSPGPGRGWSQLLLGNNSAPL